MRQTALTAAEQKFVEKVAVFLKKTPEAVISIYPFEYADKEKEYILFFEAKKKYFLLSRNDNHSPLSRDDSIRIDKMSVKDSAFVKYLDKVVPDSMMFTIQQKCLAFIGQQVVDNKFADLIKARRSAFISCFRNQDVAGRVKFHTDETGTPFNGFSFYKIDYNGEFPQNLLKDYSEIKDLNQEPPRLKFEKERQKEGVMEAKEGKRPYL